MGAVEEYFNLNNCPEFPVIKANTAPVLAKGILRAGIWATLAGYHQGPLAGVQKPVVNDDLAGKPVVEYEITGQGPP